MVDRKGAGKQIFFFFFVHTDCSDVKTVLFSVVEYRYPEDAKRAIHTMNKAEFMGRPVFVREV